MNALSCHTDYPQDGFVLRNVLSAMWNASVSLRRTKRDWHGVRQQMARTLFAQRLEMTAGHLLTGSWRTRSLFWMLQTDQPGLKEKRASPAKAKTVNPWQYGLPGSRRFRSLGA